jgi:carbon-monoxide dehydrogenase medium subunit
VFLKFGLRSGRSIAVVSVAVLLTLDSGWIRKARLALGAVSPRIQRSRRAESILLGQSPTDAVFELAAQAAAEDCAPISDLRATADYRRRLVKALTRRALELCREDRAPQVRLGVGGVPLTEVRCRVNGVETVWPAAGLTLLQALRSIGLQHDPLTGTKEGCAEGECGACTVLLDDQAVLACLTPAAAAHGRSVRTVEGLAQGEKLSALQNAFIQAGAVQCGYCTPGLLMSGTALLENYPDPTPEQIREALSGNLCRCTGYTMLVEAVTAAAHSQEVET